MQRIAWKLFFVIVLGMPLEAAGHPFEACLPQHVRTVYTEPVNFTQRIQIEAALISQQVAGHFLTNARVRLSIDLIGTLAVAIGHFQEAEISLPYRIDALEVRLAGKLVQLVDLTDQCVRSGAELFDNKHYSFPKVRIPQTLQEVCRHACMLQIRVWGQL